jgi:D-sedoheptulose 7-phosphate isomerase
MGIRTIVITGFSGGEASRRADISIHVAVNNYDIVEDFHQALMHNIVQYICGNHAPAR